jgi:hypothetical protein
MQEKIFQCLWQIMQVEHSAVPLAYYARGNLPVALAYHARGYFGSGSL